MHACMHACMRERHVQQSTLQKLLKNIHNITHTHTHTHTHTPNTHTHTRAQQSPVFSLERALQLLKRVQYSTFRTAQWMYCAPAAGRTIFFSQFHERATVQRGLCCCSNGLLSFRGRGCWSSVCTHTRTHARTHTNTHTHKHTNKHTRTHSLSLLLSLSHTHTRTYTLTHTHVCTCIHTCTHTHRYRPFLHINSSTQCTHCTVEQVVLHMGLFWGHTGLFRGNIGRFWGDVGLFRGDI